VKPSPEPELLESLLRTRDAGGQRQLIDRRPDAVSVELVRKLSDRIRERLPKDRVLAESLTESIVVLAERLDLPLTWALAYQCKACVFHNMKQCESAKPYFDRAVRLFEEARESRELGRTLCLFADNLTYLGEYSRAEELARRALSVLEDCGDAGLVATPHITLGNLFHRLHRFSEALEEYDRADAELRSSGDSLVVAAVKLNRPLVLIELNRFDEAVQAFEGAREYCARHGIALWAEILDRNIADLYFKLGRYSEALRSLEKVRTRYRVGGDERRLALADLLRAEIYLQLNLPQAAAGLAEQAETVFEEHGNRLEVAQCRLFIGIAEVERGDTAGARASFERAQDLFRQEGNSVSVAGVTLQLAKLESRERRLGEAAGLALRAAEDFESSGVWVRGAYARIVLAQVLRNQGHGPEALAEVERALSSLSGYHAKWVSYQGRALLAGLQAENGRIAEAEHLYREAIDELESLRGHIQLDEFRMSFGRDKYQVYANLVDLMIQTGRIEDAFYWVERSKSRTLLDLLERNTNAVGRSPRSSHRQRQIRKLRRDLSALYSRLAQAGAVVPATSSNRSLSDRIARLEREVIQLLREAGSENEDWVALESMPTPSVEDVRAFLSEDEVLIEYYLVRDRFSAFVIDREGLHLVSDLASTDTVRECVRGLHFQLSKFDLGEEYVRRHADALLGGVQYHLERLYEGLLAPLASFLPSGRSLVVIPHQVLHYVPFQALYDGAQYVVDTRDVAYCASSAVLKVCRQRATPETSEDLVLAVPDGSTPSIAEEAEVLRRLLPKARVFVGAEAKAELLGKLGARAGKLHIAAHGVFRSDNPMFSSLKMGDGWLSLVDVFDLNLGAELTTLSACETGMNALYEGDELLGLARGFFYAGTPSLVVSLWRVNDRSTADLMRVFYEELGRGLGKPESLRRAALEVKKTWPHPYYWAPFVLMGKS
jgi:tetratricopeptide (TPR) repeat protein